MESFRELIVWQKAMVLVEDVYRLIKGFPKEETYSLADQTKRAAVSVPANIAEGYGRQSTQDYIRFLFISRGSVYELRTHLEIATRLGYIPADSFAKAESLIIEIERMLTSLASKLKSHS